MKLGGLFQNTHTKETCERVFLVIKYLENIKISLVKGNHATCEKASK